MSFEREIALIGEPNFRKLAGAKVVVLGLGGVGSYAAEAIVRAGIGHIVAVDNDSVAESNLNRQLIALTSTIGAKKVEVFAIRAKDINDSVDVVPMCCFICADNAAQIITPDTDYVIDAIDTVSSKLAVIEHCKSIGVPIISCMGTGNKIHCRFAVTDIFKTKYDPLARVIRRELRNRGIDKLKVVCSEEEPSGQTLQSGGRNIPGSISFVPGSAGLMMAGEVIRELIAK